jgi:hypothetical protein
VIDFDEEVIEQDEVQGNLAPVYLEYLKRCEND